MNSLVAVAYVSSALRRFTPQALDALLVNARDFNLKAGVSGALLHHDGSFFQYFEGPEVGVEAVYLRIKASRSHHGLIELIAAPVDQRHFSGWSMGFASPVASDLQAISQADWLAAHQLACDQAAPAPAPALSLLLAFWQRAKG